MILLLIEYGNTVYVGTTNNNLDKLDKHLFIIPIDQIMKRRGKTSCIEAHAFGMNCHPMIEIWISRLSRVECQNKYKTIDMYLLY